MLPADTKSVATALRCSSGGAVYSTPSTALYTTLPGFQKAQMNNPMVDVDLKANTTKAENYRGSEQRCTGNGSFLKHFQFKAMFSLDYASNSTRTYTPVIQVYDASVEGDIATLGNGRTRSVPSQRSGNEGTERLSADLHQLLGRPQRDGHSGFPPPTTSRKSERRPYPGVGLVIPDNPTNGT